MLVSATHRTHPRSPTASLTSTVTYGLANELCKPCKGISKTKRSPWTSRSRSCHDWWCDSSDASEVANGLADVRANDIVTDGLSIGLFMYQHFIRYPNASLSILSWFCIKEEGFLALCNPFKFKLIYKKKFILIELANFLLLHGFLSKQIELQIEFLLWDLCVHLGLANKGPSKWKVLRLKKQWVK